MNDRQTPSADAPVEAALPPLPTPEAAPALERESAPEAEPAPPRTPFDPYAGSRHLPWMDRRFSPSARAARRMWPELKGFAAIEGREPNGADLDDMAARISAEMVEIFRREWAADVVDEWLEERDAARVGRPVDPSVGPKPQLIGGDPRDTRPRVFVAEPEDIDWVIARLGRQRPDVVPASFGRRQVKWTPPGSRPFPLPRPPLVRPDRAPQAPPGGSRMTPADPETPSSPPPFPAAEPPPPIPPTPAAKPLLREFEALIPPNLKEIFRPIPGSEAIAKGGEPFYIPGPSIGDPGLLVPIHIFSVRARSQGIEHLAISGLVDPDKLIEIQPLYGRFEELARQAGRIVGPGKGPQHGTYIHSELEELIKGEVAAKRLPRGVNTEVSYTADGQETRGRPKGSMRIDIIYDDSDTVYIFELKTGGAALKEPRIDRTLNLQAFRGRKVIVMELNPWRLPRK